MLRVITVHEARSSRVLTNDGVESGRGDVLAEYEAGVVGPSMLLERKGSRNGTQLVIR